MNEPNPIIRKTMPELDTLRGIAILAVVFYHGLFWSSNLVGLSGVSRVGVNATRFGWLGVNLFFVLSGFLITGILEDSKNSPHFFRRFYIRRALRILPAYYGLLLILAFVPSQNGSYLFLGFFYLSNLAPLLHIPNTYPMLWSLAAEEHFYLLWPLLVWFLARRSLMWVAFGLFVGTAALRGVWFHDPLPQGFHGFTWLVADGFSAGAILALVVRDPWCTRKRFAWAAGLCGAIAVIALAAASPFGILTRFRFLGAVFMLSIANLLFAGAMGLALLVATGRWKTALNVPILAFFGDISYGLYLIHWLIFIAYDAIIARYFGPAYSFVANFKLLAIRFCVVFAAATFLAWLSRRHYEERFLRLKSRFS